MTDEIENPRAKDTSDESATRASELAHRALQEAVLALMRARTSRLTPLEIDELETAVARARQLVASAQFAQNVARNATDTARAQRAISAEIRKEAVAQGERARRGFMALVTWGRRKTTCTTCHREFVVAFRCSTHEPQTVATVRCAFDDCGAAQSCRVPESAYAFATRPIGKR